MGLFSRRAAPVDTNTATAAGTHPTTHDGLASDTTHSTMNPTGTHGEKGIKHHGRSGGRHHGTYPDTLNSRPTFGQWIKGTWIDILTMVALGAIGLGVSTIINCG
jgi:hypothetical protein